MAHMAVYLKFRPRLYPRASAHVHSSSSISHFSSSSDKSDETPPNTENPQTSSRHAFSDVLSNLKGSDRQQFQQPPRQGFTYPQRPRQTPPSSVDLDEIRKNLSGFSQRSNSSGSGSGSFQRSQGQPLVSFQSMYKQLSEKSSEIRGFSGKERIDSIRNSMPVNNSPKEGLRVSLASLKETLNMKKKDGSKAFQHNMFQNELSEKPTKEVADPNELCKEYSKDELGEKLRNLRPEGVVEGQNWFSLTELNQRLIKLRESELNNTPPETRVFTELRMTLKKVIPAESDSRMYNPKVGIFSKGDITKDYMLLPPKEKLVEQYYHPDNMSSAEKLKLKLKAVRDEFKMSETDCGSTRVQIAQLTTEILHLSKVLHKKDKHSLKGLLAKVQLRKKLLKYLRRTDWDSYCYILSKLGLRDNPGYKQH